jgi:hypothetical protein
VIDKIIPFDTIPLKSFGCRVISPTLDPGNAQAIVWFEPTLAPPQTTSCSTPSSSATLQ